MAKTAKKTNKGVAKYDLIRLPPEIYPDAKIRGRPPKYPENEESIKKIVSISRKFFKKCMEKGRVPTVPGLALELGFCDRHSVWELSKSPYFSHTIKDILLKIEEIRLQMMFVVKNTGAVIFSLKNGFGYSDAQKIDITSGGEKIGKSLFFLPDAQVAILPGDPGANSNHPDANPVPQLQTPTDGKADGTADK